MLILTNNIILLVFLIYTFLVFISALGVKLNSCGVDNFLCLITVLTYVILIFARTGLGVDESTYLESYHYYIQGGESDFEYGFDILFWGLKLLGVTESSFNTIFPLLILTALCFAVTISVKNPFRSFVLIFTIFSSFFLDFTFNAYRQGLSFWFVLLAIESYLSGYRRKFIVYCLIGLGFHWSAAVVLFMLFLTRFLSTRLAVFCNIFLFFLTLVAAIMPLHLLSILVTLIQHLPLNSSYLQKVIFYLTTIKSSFYDLNFFGRAPLIIYALILMSLLAIYRKQLPTVQFKLLILLLGYSVLLLEMSYSFRNYYWVLPFTPFIMAKILSCNVNKKKLMVIYTVFATSLWFLSIASFYSFPILSMIFQ
ncbi:EpsG family protein [Escherichia marmotae]|uniref:EpsG family protein n=1 Tax=Escherichia marmotae TaxID=1499973 RepID=UPI0027E0E27C|nr:EpsG family protein [Escherichia marmotae]MDZ3933157.1 EpsG family protein [Escherichia marmotae]MEC9867642.1 EpsG family protein [Escherichia marmotae]MEC9926991.1 EpsG family protein [Escherichia marmotae]MEC9976089.1 EpsG family protein [Escherichia marmotae]MED0431038.1 EpsG family protein [Escherichia marmotae]